MKNRSYMLPNYYKKVGWIMLVCTPVFFVLGLLAFRWELIANMHSRYLTMILYMMLFAGIFMVVLSEEKEEDEMIMSIRRNSVSLTALVVFVLYIAASLTIAFAEGFRSLQFGGIYRFHAIISNIMTPFLIYLAIFRFRIWRLRRQCKEDNT